MELNFFSPNIWELIPQSLEDKTGVSQWKTTQIGNCFYVRVLLLLISDVILIYYC